MNTILRVSAVALMCALFTIGNLCAQEEKADRKEPAIRIHGLMFGDYFYKIAGDSTEVSATQYSKAVKDYQAFQFRRLYLYSDFRFNESFAAQMLFEGTDKSLDPGGRFGVFVKLAYLEWKNVFDHHNLNIGLTPTPSWGLAEKSWGYRSIEKTISDMRGLAIPCDLGISLRKVTSEDDVLGYTVMIGNGTGTKPEANKFKKYYAEVNVTPLKGLVIEANAEFEPMEGSKDKMMVKGLLIYRLPGWVIGVESVMQQQSNVNTQGDKSVALGVSGFVGVEFATDLNAFVRFDRYDPNTNVGDAGFREHFIVAGLDYKPIPNVHLIPNLWVNTFASKSSGQTKNADIVARLTFSYDYK